MCGSALNSSARILIMVHPFACQQGPKARYRLQGIFWLILEANRRRITHSRGKSRLLSASPTVPRLLARIRQAHLSHINDEPIKRLLCVAYVGAQHPHPLLSASCGDTSGVGPRRPQFAACRDTARSECREPTFADTYTDTLATRERTTIRREATKGSQRQTHRSLR